MPGVALRRSAFCPFRSLRRPASPESSARCSATARCRGNAAIESAHIVSDMADLIEMHIPALRRFALALLREKDSADDLVQDCLERAVSRWHSRRSEGDLRAWLFAIQHNCYLDDRRRLKRRGIHVTLEAIREEPAVGPSQEGALHCDDVVAALAKLPTEQRTILLLVAVEDMTYAEAAQIVGVPVGTVMSRLSRGREKLRHLISGEGPADSKHFLRIVK